MHIHRLNQSTQFNTTSHSIGYTGTSRIHIGSSFEYLPRTKSRQFPGGSNDHFQTQHILIEPPYFPTSPRVLADDLFAPATLLPSLTVNFFHQKHSKWLRLLDALASAVDVRLSAKAYADEQVVPPVAAVVPVVVLSVTRRRSGEFLSIGGGETAMARAGIANEDAAATRAESGRWEGSRRACEHGLRTSVSMRLVRSGYFCAASRSSFKHTKGALPCRPRRRPAPLFPMALRPLGTARSLC